MKTNLEQKENKIWTKDKIEPQHIYLPYKLFLQAFRNKIKLGHPYLKKNLKLLHEVYFTYNQEKTNALWLFFYPSCKFRIQFSWDSFFFLF